MRSHLAEFDQKFAPVRNHIIESLQVRLAYILRKRIAERKERERLALIQQKRNAEAAKKQALKEKRMKKKQAELERI